MNGKFFYSNNIKWWPLGITTLAVIMTKLRIQWARKYMHTASDSPSLILTFSCWERVVSVSFHEPGCLN